MRRALAALLAALGCATAAPPYTIGELATAVERACAVAWTGAEEQDVCRGRVLTAAQSGPDVYATLVESIRACEGYPRGSYTARGCMVGIAYSWLRGVYADEVGSAFGAAGASAVPARPAPTGCTYTVIDDLVVSQCD